jgi:hypothetical protein
MEDGTKEELPKILKPFNMAKNFLFDSPFGLTF